MYYETFKPAKPLVPYVDHFWLLVSGPEPTQPIADIVLPDGRIELIVHFADHFSISHGGDFTKQARSLLAGQMTERIFLKPTGMTGMIAARFKAFGTFKFFDFPLHHLINQVVSLDSCLGSP